MSENIFASWKRWFPILRDLRLHLKFAQKVIVATAILENLSWLWGQEDIDSEDDEIDDDNGNGDIVVHDNAEDTVRRRGQLVRDNMLRNMQA